MMPLSVLQGTIDMELLQPDTSCGYPSICEEGNIRKDTPELIPVECCCEKDEASK